MTEDGAAFRARCTAILAELEQAEREMLDRAARPAGLLRIELPVAFGRLRIVPALARLTERHPDLRIEASFADTLTDPISAGLDALVRIGVPHDLRLMARRVGVVRYICCAAPSYIARHGQPLAPADLDRHACIRRVAHDGSGEAEWRFAPPGGGEPFSRAVPGTLGFGSNDAIVDAALAGAGVAQLHDYMADAHLRSGALVQVLTEYSVDGPPVSVLFPSGRHLAPKVRAFIDAVASAVG